MSGHNVPEFVVTLSATILWPVKLFIPQEDDVEKEITLLFRFKRPLTVDTKAYREAKKRRIERESKDFDERIARPLRRMSSEQLKTMPSHLVSDEIMALAKADEPEKVLTEDERDARLEALFSPAANRRQWWLGWKSGSMKDAEGKPLDPDDAEHRAYVLGIDGMEEAVNRAIDEIMTGGRQKNSLPSLVS